MQCTWEEKLTGRTNGALNALELVPSKKDNALYGCVSVLVSDPVEDETKINLRGVPIFFFFKEEEKFNREAIEG